MPNIQVELRVQVEGSGTPALVRRTSLSVASCQQISLIVEGVKPQRGEAPGRKPYMQATYTPGLENVKLAAIFDAGQASGLKVKVGSGKFLPLTQPMVFTERLSQNFGRRARIILQNESTSQRTAVLLVGCDLPDEGRKVERLALPARKPMKAKRGKTAKKKGRK